MGIAGVTYDASAGIIETAFRYSSTIIPLVFEGVEFWCLLLFNLSIFASRHMNLFDPEAYHIDLPWSLTGVTGSLMTFFVCFYNQHVFGRYNKLYNLTKAMCEGCLEIVSILRVQVENKSAARRIAKLVMSSCFMFFYERTDSIEGGRVSAREYKQLKSLSLLGDKEVAHLQRHCERYKDDAMPSFMVLHWAMDLMRHETPTPDERDDMLAGFYSRVYHVRKCQAEVVQILDLPMPFQYFHIMNLMLILNLVLWAYSLGCQDSLFAPVIYMFVQMMFQGIRELSTALSDPFGDDEVDFPVNDWMLAVYARMYGVLEDTHDTAQLDLGNVRPMLDPAAAHKIIDLHVDTERKEEEGRTPEGYRSVSQRDDDDQAESDRSEDERSEAVSDSDAEEAEASENVAPAGRSGGCLLL